MNDAQTTCWTLIRGAAQGDADERDAFARRYDPAIRAYLVARWERSALRQDVDDAVQEVFIECFKDGGALKKVTSDRPGGFRAFLYGVTRNVAMRYETKRARGRELQAPTGFHAAEADATEDRMSQIFDRAWAQSIMQEAADLQSKQAVIAGDEALRRVELLRLRFGEGLPIREIAQRWSADPVLVHRAYSKARKEFKMSLLEVMSFYCPGSAELAEEECNRLLALLA
jgi:RNA polymerase sigma-70 factor (ECF subfamily)